jgi:hypothetical protein
MTTKEQRRVYSENWRKKNKEKVNEYQRERYESLGDNNPRWNKRNPEAFSEWSRKWRIANPVRHLYQGIKARAKRNGIPFDVTEEDLVIPSHCPVTGVKLEHSRMEGGRHRQADNSPSFDRINPALGYVKGNVICVSWRVNNIKSDATPEELINIGNYYQGLVNGKEK